VTLRRGVRVLLPELDRLVGLVGVRARLRVRVGVRVGARVRARVRVRVGVRVGARVRARVRGLEQRVHASQVMRRLPERSNFIA
jgi:predicted thioesterase